jgi:hypothetical protein
MLRRITLTAVSVLVVSTPGEKYTSLLKSDGSLKRQEELTR